MAPKVELKCYRKNCKLKVQTIVDTKPCCADHALEVLSTKR